MESVTVYALVKSEHLFPRLFEYAKQVAPNTYLLKKTVKERDLFLYLSVISCEHAYVINYADECFKKLFSDWMFLFEFFGIYDEPIWFRVWVRR